MTFAILGMGRVGHNMACYLARQGCEVIGWDRNKEKIQAINKYGITVSGAFAGNFKVKATTDITEAIRSAKFILVTTDSAGHKPVAEGLSGRLRDGQRIVIFTGNWGAYEFYSLLKNEAAAKQVVIGETSGNLMGSPSLEYPAATKVKAVKAQMTFATIPAQAVHNVIEELKEYFPQFTAVDNVLETSLSNANSVVHTPIIMANFTRIESGEDFFLYGEQSATRHVVNLVEKVDAERAAVAKAMGLTPSLVLDNLNSSWATEHDNLFDALTKNESYKVAKGPKSLNHRFFFEDFPFGVMAIAALGKMYGVPTPRMDALISFYFYYLGDCAVKEGPVFKRELLEQIK